MKLVIGNIRYSSWSLRPWVLMRHFGIPFDESLIPLDLPETREQILKFSPSGKVPALVDGSLVIWESLAIAEYLNEKYPEKNMWPKDAQLRARARSISNEMSSGFMSMRNHMPHDLQKKLKQFDWSKAKSDVERVCQIWRECLLESKTDFLFGNLSIADVMFAPVANRFVSYGIPLDESCQRYVNTIRNLPAHLEWIQRGEKEQLEMPRYL